MFTPTLRCECAQPGLIDTMRKWSIGSVRLPPSLGLFHLISLSDMLCLELPLLFHHAKAFILSLHYN